MEKLISVIVPVYNVEKYLQDCVESIINQTYKNLEIILVDDGATDTSGKLCDEFAIKDNRIKVIHKTNGGLSDARNAGLDVARGEYISFIDSDDWIAPDMYEKMMAAISEYEVDLCCAGRYDVYDGTKFEGLCPRENGKITSSDFLKRMLIAEECDVSVWDKLFKKELFDGIRFPFGEINEDAAVIHLVVDRARFVGIITDRVYNYRHRAGSITTTSFSERNFILIKHAKDILDFVSSNYCEIQNYALSNYARKLLDVCGLLVCASKPTRKKYKAQLKATKKELKKNKKYLFSRDKKRYICLKLGIYKLAKTIKRKLSGK